MSEQEFREAVRAEIARAFGPEVMHEALETDEARSYIAAREQADAEMEDFRRKVTERAEGLADELSAMLPDGYRFEWR